jgi:hypothetical protein
VLLASSLTSRIHEYIPGSGGVNTGNCNGSAMLVISSIKRGTGFDVSVINGSRKYLLSRLNSIFQSSTEYLKIPERASVHPFQVGLMLSW